MGVCLTPQGSGYNDLCGMGWVGQQLWLALNGGHTGIQISQYSKLHMGILIQGKRTCSGPT